MHLVCLQKLSYGKPLLEIHGAGVLPSVKTFDRVERFLNCVHGLCPATEDHRYPKRGIEQRHAGLVDQDGMPLPRHYS